MKDDRDAGCLDLIEQEVGLARPVEDQSKVKLTPEPEGGRDVLGTVSGHDHRHLAGEDRAHRLEGEVPGGGAALVGGLSLGRVLLGLDQLGAEHGHHLGPGPRGRLI